MLHCGPYGSHNGSECCEEAIFSESLKKRRKVLDKISTTHLGKLKWEKVDPKKMVDAR